MSSNIQSTSNFYIGLMSGTSMDAIDAIIVNFLPDEIDVIASLTYPIPEELKNQLIKLNHHFDGELHLSQNLNRELGKLFAEATNALLEKSHIPRDQIIAIGSHGQTIRHNVEQPPFYSLQIGDPHSITHLTGIKTVADFRNGDIVAGGQGAPLAPAFHLDAFGQSEINKVVLNIGGISNITNLWKDSSKLISGFDTGPGNLLMDAWCLEKTGKTFDKNGDWAASGKTNNKLLKVLKSEAYLSTPPPKSSGRELFNLNWLTEKIKEADIDDEAVNIQTTLCNFTAQTIADAITKWGPDEGEVLICGGGVHNKFLFSLIEQSLPNFRIHSTSKYQVDPDYLEAIAFAWFAKRRIEGKTANIPSVTGANKSVLLGAIYEP